MKTFVNLLKLLALATIVTSCAYEKDPGLLPAAHIDNIDILDKKLAPEVLKTKYTSLSAVCSLAAKAASGTTTIADVIEETDGSVTNPEGNGQAPEKLDPPVVTPPSTAASGTVTVDFLAQLAKDPKLANKITDAVMVLDISSSASGTASATTTVKRVTVNLTVEPLTFKDNETMAVGTTVYVMKHSPRMTATASITTALAGPAGASDTQTAGASDTQTVSVVEGIQSKVDSDKTGVSIVCDLKGTPDDKNELVKGQWIKVDCAANENDIKDNAEKAVFKQNCKDGQPNLPKAPPPAVQGEGSPFPNP